MYVEVPMCSCRVGMTTGEAQRMMEHKQGRVLTASEEISETLHNTNLALASLNEGWIYFSTSCLEAKKAWYWRKLFIFPSVF